MENESDLRRYVRVLIKHRWIIIATTVLAALAALASTYAGSSRPGPPLYEATAGVLIVRIRTQVTFDPRFRTIEDSPATNYITHDAHRIALANLVRNGVVATKVAERMEEELGVEGWEPAQLLPLVRGEIVVMSADETTQSVVDASNLIQITVTFAEPEQAAWIANAWAEAYVDHINDLYGIEAASLDTIQGQVDDAQRVYERAEQALISFSATDRSADLAHQIADKEALIRQLRTAQQAVYLEASRNEQATLGEYYAAARQSRQMLENATTLRQQVLQSDGAAATANEVALLLLKAQAFAAAGELPAELDLHITLGADEPLDTAAQIAELDALIGVLSERLAEVERDIEKQSALLSSAEYYDATDSSAFDETIDGLQVEMGQLRAQLAQEQAKEKELTRARDLAWDTYSTLHLKAAELTIGAELADVEVRLASPALTASLANTTGTSGGASALAMGRSIGVAAVVGLLLGVGMAFFLHTYDPAYDSAEAIGKLFKRREEKERE
jgi:uncharacterized protein involved in exopolysaccharide biosynthesis